MNLFTNKNPISAFKNAGKNISAKNDLRIVVSYIESRLKAELNRARFNEKMGANIDFSNDDLLNQAEEITSNALNDIEEINQLTNLHKKAVIKAKNVPGAVLSPDEIYAIDVTALKDIKKAGLRRALTREEILMLKQAIIYINMLYAEQVQSYKTKQRTR